MGPNGPNRSHATRVRGRETAPDEKQRSCHWGPPRGPAIHRGPRSAARREKYLWPSGARARKDEARAPRTRAERGRRGGGRARAAERACPACKPHASRPTRATPAPRAARWAPPGGRDGEAAASRGTAEKPCLRCVPQLSSHPPAGCKAAAPGEACGLPPGPASLAAVASQNVLPSPWRHVARPKLLI